MTYCVCKICAGGHGTCNPIGKPPTKKSFVPLQYQPFDSQYAISATMADMKCSEFTIEQLLEHFNTIQSTNFTLHQGGIGELLQHLLVKNYDFGKAYAKVHALWNSTSDKDNIYQRFMKRKEERIFDDQDVTCVKKGVFKDSINNLENIKPRRLWDICANRVVPFYYSVNYTVLGHVEEEFWAVTHSWTAEMADGSNSVRTSVNEEQWPVPIPYGVTLDHVRNEFLHLGAKYVWLDVLCMRQRWPRDKWNAIPRNVSSTITQTTNALASTVTSTRSKGFMTGLRTGYKNVAGVVTSTGKNAKDTVTEVTSNEKKDSEWRFDVPTIGLIYHRDRKVIRYFNGLGKPCVAHGWDDRRHWLKRSWTLQETCPRTTNAGKPNDGDFFDESFLKEHLDPILQLEVDRQTDPKGRCLLLALDELKKRHSTDASDRPRALYTWFCSPKLPVYRPGEDTEEAWRRCIKHMRPTIRAEMLFRFPATGVVENTGSPLWCPSALWRPSWGQAMNTSLTWIDVEDSLFDAGKGVELNEQGDACWTGPVFLGNFVANGSEEGTITVKGNDREFKVVTRTDGLRSAEYIFVGDRKGVLWIMCDAIGNSGTSKRKVSVVEIHEDDREGFLEISPKVPQTCTFV